MAPNLLILVLLKIRQTGRLGDVCRQAVGSPEFYANQGVSVTVPASDFSCEGLKPPVNQLFTLMFATGIVRYRKAWKRESEVICIFTNRVKTGGDLFSAGRRPLFSNFLTGSDCQTVYLKTRRKKPPHNDDMQDHE